MDDTQTVPSRARAIARRQVWWVGAAIAAFVMAGIGRLIDSNWLYGNMEHCDSWYSLGEQVLMGSAADQQFHLARQTVRVADIVVGGTLYAFLPTTAAQFLVAAFWLAVPVVALTAAARRLFGGRGYWLALVATLTLWPFYTAVATDFVNRTVVAALAVGVFGAVLARDHRRTGTILAAAMAVVGFFTEPASAPAVLGVVLAAALVSIGATRPAGGLRRLGATVVDLVVGGVGGVAGLLVLGNVTGSAPGVDVVDITVRSIAAFFEFTPETSARFHVPVRELLTTRPLAALLMAVSAPGVAVVVAWLVRDRTRLAWRSRLMAIHAANVIAIVVAIVLQARGAAYLSEDYYVVWFMPLALTSFLMVVLDLVPRPATRRDLVASAAALAVVAAIGCWCLWFVDLPFLGTSGNWVLLTWAGIALVAVLVVPRGWVLAGLVAAPLVLASGVQPIGYGATAWALRAGPSFSPYSPAELQWSAVAALRLIGPLAVDPTGPAVWWLSHPEDFLQSRLPRSSVQCPVSYPASLRPTSEGTSVSGVTYAGYFAGAPTRLVAVPEAGVPPTARSVPSAMKVPDGQILMAVVGPGEGGTDWPQSVVTDLRAVGVRARVRGTADLAGGHRVAALTIECPGDTCTLPYSAPPAGGSPTK